MKLIYFGQEAWEEAYIREKLQGVDMVWKLGTVQDNVESDPDAEALSIFVNSRVGGAELDRYPKLKLIATRSTGFDHIDMVEVRKRAIAVVTVPSYGVNTVAEFAFALLLSLSRRIVEANDQVVHDGSFSQRGLTGFDLKGKTIAVIGCGRIGVHSIKIAKGFGMQVIVFDSHQDEALAKELDFTYASLEDALAQADVITVHVPYNQHTHHLINKNNVSKLKKGVYIINTARGAVIETEALIDGLQKEIIGGAGLDVLEEEGSMDDEMQLLSGPHPEAAKLKVMLENHYLMKHPRVIITPHIAFDTAEAIRRILTTTAENIRSFMSGAPQNLLP